MGKSQSVQGIVTSQGCGYFIRYTAPNNNGKQRTVYEALRKRLVTFKEKGGGNEKKCLATVRKCKYGQHVLGCEPAPCSSGGSSDEDDANAQQEAKRSRHDSATQRRAPIPKQAYAMVALALFFLLQSIDFNNMGQMKDDIPRDSSLATRFCNGCSIKFATHAHLVSSTNEAFCDICKPSGAEVTTMLIVSREELQELFQFVGNHWPNPLTIIQPTDQERWLRKLASVEPRTQRIQPQVQVKLSLQELKQAIDKIIKYERNKNNKVPHPSGFKNADAVLSAMEDVREHPQLHPYVLPSEAHVLHDLMEALRSTEESVHAFRNVLDRVSSTLVFFSPAGAVTPFHFDWTEAKNVALWIQELGLRDEDVVAVWYLLNPLFLAVFFDFFSKFSGPWFGKSKGKKKFAQDVCEQFIEKYGSGAMKRMEHKVCWEMYVPPGWLHAVFTVKKCVKMAWDFAIVEKFPLYMAAWSYVGVQLAKNGAKNSDDFMAIGDVAVNYALKPPRA